MFVMDFGHVRGSSYFLRLGNDGCDVLLTFDLKSHGGESIADALQVIALDLDRIVFHGPAGTVFGLESLQQRLKIIIDGGKPADDGNHAAAASLLDGQLRRLFRRRKILTRRSGQRRTFALRLQLAAPLTGRRPVPLSPFEQSHS